MSDGKNHDEVVGGDGEAKRTRWENERMTRRQALRKFGFTAGMTVFAALSVDDLARLASKKLQESEVTKGIGDTLAKEFHAAGVALANPIGGAPGYYATNPCAAGGNAEACNGQHYNRCVARKGYAGAAACKRKAEQCELAGVIAGDEGAAAAVDACWKAPPKP